MTKEVKLARLKERYKILSERPKCAGMGVLRKIRRNIQRLENEI